MSEEPTIRMIGDRRMQCKDIPDEVFLGAVMFTPDPSGSFEPLRWRMRPDVKKTLELAMGPIPAKVFIAKARKLMKAKKLGGCECSDCRGDYHIYCGRPFCCEPGFTRVKEEMFVRPNLFAEFAGSMVRINDENGNEIGQGRMDANGLVTGMVDGVEYTQQLTHLRMEEE